MGTVLCAVDCLSAFLISTHPVPRARGNVERGGLGGGQGLDKAGSCRIHGKDFDFHPKSTRKLLKSFR